MLTVGNQGIAATAFACQAHEYHYLKTFASRNWQGCPPNPKEFGVKTGSMATQTLHLWRLLMTLHLCKQRSLGYLEVEDTKTMSRRPDGQTL